MNEAMKAEEKPEKEELFLPELPAGESRFHQLIDLISSLISLSHTVKAFPAKWKSIRTRLEQLNSSIIAAENCNPSENSAFSNIILSILSSVIKCHDLARRCINLSYSGKLLMHSDLDVVLANFGRHLNDFTKIYTSGILINKCAIVVSKPSAGAGIDDMKFYIRDLFTRLKIGDCKMKHQALIALNELLLEDAKYAKIIVETEEIVGLLVSFLEFEELGIQEESAKAIMVIASFNSYKGILIEASVIAPLIQVLEVGSDLGKETAARALQKLTENSNNAWSISAHGGVTLLLKICSECTGREQLISSACHILNNLAGVDDIRRFLIEEGAISVVVKLSRSKHEVLQIRVVEFLQTMASGDDSVRQMIIREGGIWPLLQVLDPRSSFSTKTREVALLAIDNLCFVSHTSINTLMGSEFLSWIIFFMRNGDISIQESAAKTSFCLSGTSDETRKAMGDTGFMPELVKLLNSKSPEIRELAAKALLNMVLLPRNRKRFIHENPNVIRVLQLLNPEDEKSDNKKLLLSLLMLLTNSNTARRKIASSEYNKNLEKLAEAGVIDAKRIIKKLSENRFRTILSGIWKA
ncbi:hypothetical protein MRB53_030903 [Persea americana]|uniref:Uncharacterized protein n=1 Tax=Persea americana TaxID=3435 RepID=A0ACC2KMJ7_PERAE|nr:hypothetical protein MRB53_030903 [Persea americana]